MKMYLVGGMVRDHLLGLDHVSQDYDFAVEAESFDHMESTLVDEMGAGIWKRDPAFVTLRAQVPMQVGAFGGLVRPKPGHKPGLRDYVMVNADFTLCREETMYTDMRHPDTVTPADLITDLKRRDFTVNAAAVSIEGNLFDPFGAQTHAKAKLLTCVGLTEDRMKEDPLRLLRALRFMVKYGFTLDMYLARAMNDEYLLSLLKTLPTERVREELTKAMEADWYETMRELMVRSPRMGRMLHQMFPALGFKAVQS